MQHKEGSAPSASLEKPDYLNLLLLLLLAAGTRFYRLGDASFWADEVFTLKFASLPWSTLWVSAYEATPPLYYTIVRLLMDAGTAEWWIRLPSAFAGTLTVLLAYLAVRKIAGSRAALAAGLLLSLSAANIEYSQEARAYALVGMWMAVSFLGLASLHARWRTGTSGFTFTAFLGAGGALYAFGALGALYSHNVAVFYWLGAQCFFLGWWLSPFRFSRALLASWFAVNLAVLVAWTPWLIASLQVIESEMFSWLVQYDPAGALAVWRGANGFETGYGIDVLLDVGLVLLALMGLFCLRNETSLAFTFVAMLVCSSLLMWSWGFVSGPIFMRRSVLWGSVFFYMLAGIGISRLPVMAGRAVLLVLVGAGLVAVFNYDRYHRAENTDWHSPASVFNEQGGENDLFLFRTTWPAPAFLHYLEGDQAHRRVLGWSCTTRQPLFGAVQAGEHFSRVAWSDSNPGWKDNDITASSVWVIENLCHDSMSINLSNEWLAQNWIQARSYGFKGVTLHQWVPKSRFVAPGAGN